MTHRAVARGCMGGYRDWCGAAGRVVVKPVIDLNHGIGVEQYEVPDRMAERVRLRDHTCAFPWCSRPATGCDTDHITPYPHVPTHTDDLAPLCRRHHRLKTHGAWSYTAIHPGTYLWRSPHGHHYLRDHTGTRVEDP